jgi:threonine synthase
MEKNGGHYITVGDDEILMAIKEMTELTGVFAEPAGATPYAGLKKMIKNGTIKKSDQVVLLVSGSGLKDPKAYEKGLKDGIFKL